MKAAKLRIVTDTPPPAIIAHTPLEAPSPIADLVAVEVPARHGRYLDVDGILARSLPRVGESFEKAA